MGVDIRGLELPEIDRYNYSRTLPFVASSWAVTVLGAWKLSQQSGWRWGLEVYGTYIVLTSGAMLHLVQRVEFTSLNESELRRYRVWRCVTRPTLHLGICYLALRLLGIENPVLRTVHLNILGVVTLWQSHRQSRVDEYLATVDHRRKFFNDHNGMVKLFTEGDWTKAFEAVERVIGTAKQRKRVVAALLTAQKAADVVRLCKRYWIDQERFSEVFHQLTGGDAKLFGNGGGLSLLRLAYLGKKKWFDPCGEDPVAALSSLKNPVGIIKSTGSLWRLLARLDGFSGDSIDDVSSHIFDHFYGKEERNPEVFRKYLNSKAGNHVRYDLSPREDALAFIHALNDFKPSVAVAMLGKKKLSDDLVELLDTFSSHDPELLRGPPLCVFDWDKDYESWFEANLKGKPLRRQLQVYFRLGGEYKWDKEKKKKLLEHLSNADWLGALDRPALIQCLSGARVDDVIKVLSIVPLELTGKHSVGSAYHLLISLTRLKALKPEDIKDVSSPIFDDFYGKEKRDPKVFQHYAYSCGRIHPQHSQSLTRRQDALAFVHWLNQLAMPEHAIHFARERINDEVMEFLNELWGFDRELLRGPPLCVISRDKDFDIWFESNLKDQPLKKLLSVYLTLTGEYKWDADKKKKLYAHLGKANWVGVLDSSELILYLRTATVDDAIKVLEILPPEVTGECSVGSAFRVLARVKCIRPFDIKDVSSPIFDDFYGEEERELKVFQLYLRWKHFSGEELKETGLSMRWETLARVHWLNEQSSEAAVEKVKNAVSVLSDDAMKILDKFWRHDRELLRGPPLCIVNWDKDYDIWFETNLKDQPLEKLLEVYLTLGGDHAWDREKREKLLESLGKADWLETFDRSALIKSIWSHRPEDVIPILALLPPELTGERSVGRYYRFFASIPDIIESEVKDVSSPIFNDFYKDEVRDPAVFRAFLRSLDINSQSILEDLSSRQNAHLGVQKLNERGVKLASAQLSLMEVLDDEEIEVFWKFWRHPPGILLKWLLERGLDNDRYSQWYDKLMEDANSYTQISAYCHVPELHGKQPALLEKLRSSVKPFEIHVHSKLELMGRYFSPDGFYNLRQCGTTVQDWGGMLPQILLAPEGQGRRELTFELLHPSVWDRGAPGWREVDWRDIEQFKEDEWPLIALEKQCIAKGSQLEQLTWMMGEDWREVPSASKAFETVLALCSNECIVSEIRNLWADKMQWCDNLKRVRAVLGKKREIVPALVDQFLVHKSSLEQLVWMVMNLPLDEDNWAAVGEGIARYAKRCTVTFRPFEEVKQIDTGFESICHHLTPHLNQYRGFKVAQRAFSKEQLEVFLRLPIVRERVIAALEKWKISDRLNLLRLLLKECDDKVLKSFVTDKMLSALAILSAAKEHRRDRTKIHAFLFRACSPAQLGKVRLLKMARLVVEDKYNWKRESCFCRWSQETDVMPLAAMLFQCKHHGGAEELLSWLEQQEWKNEGRVPHAIKRLNKIIKESGV